MSVEDTEDLDCFHAETLFSPSSLSAEQYPSWWTTCQIHQDYVIFLVDYSLYLWFPHDKKGDEELPVPILYNVYSFILTSRDSPFLLVINSVGDLLVVQIHLSAFQAPSTPDPGPGAGSSEAVRTITTEEERHGGSLSDNSKPDDQAVEILLEIDLSGSEIDTTMCELNFHSQYNLLFIYIPSSPKLQMLSFDCDLKQGKKSKWDIKQNVMIDLSSHLSAWSLFSIWGPLHDPFMIINDYSTSLYMLPLNSIYDNTGSSHENSLVRISSKGDDSYGDVDNVNDDLGEHKSQGINLTAMVVKRSFHRTWLSALSVVDPILLKNNPTSPANSSIEGEIFAISGDATGGLCIWHYFPVVNEEEEAKEAALVDEKVAEFLQPIFSVLPLLNSSSRRSRWKLLWTEKDFSYLNSEITLILSCSSSSEYVWIADRSGQLALINFSHKSRQIYFIHKLTLFPRPTIINQVVFVPVLERKFDCPFQIRIWSQEWKECVECWMSKSISIIERVWPEGHKLLIPTSGSSMRGKEDMVKMIDIDPSLTTTRSLQPTFSSTIGGHGLVRKVIYACTIMPYAQVIAVVDWTSTVFFYHLQHGNLLHTLTLQVTGCRYMLSFDTTFLQTSSFLFLTGHQSGTVLVYLIKVNTDLYRNNEDYDREDDFSEGSLDSIDSQDSFPFITTEINSAISSLPESNGNKSNNKEITSQAMALDLLESTVLPLSLPPISSTSRTIGSTTSQMIGRSLPSISSQSKERLKLSYSLTCEIIHSLQPSYFPVTELFLSNNAQTLVVIGQRQYFFQYDHITAQPTFSARKGNSRMKALVPTRDRRLDYVATCVNIVESIPEEHRAGSCMEESHIERLLLMVQSLNSVQLLNGLDLVMLTTFSLNSAASLGIISPFPTARSSIPKIPLTNEKVHQTVPPMAMTLIWDYRTLADVQKDSSTSNPLLSKRSSNALSDSGIEANFDEDDKNSQDTSSTVLDSKTRERGMIGLSASSLLHFVRFSDQQGFHFLPDLQEQIQSYLSSESNLPRDDKIFGLSGCSSDQSPIVVAWSSTNLFLLRIQLHREAGPLVMRVKRFRLGKPGQCPSIQVIKAAALPLLPKVRYHQVVVVLSTGFTFVVKL